MLVGVIGYNYYCCKNELKAGAGRFAPQALPHEITSRVDMTFLFSNYNVLPTGDERAEQAEGRAQLLAERLRYMGIDPKTL